MPTVPPISTDNKSLLPHPPIPKRLRAAAYVGLPRRRGRRMPTVRLGSRRGLRSGGRFLFGFLRRLRLKWLSTQYSRYMKRLRAYYSKVVKDIIDGAAAMETAQTRILMETYFALPVMPMSLTTGNAFGPR